MESIPSKNLYRLLIRDKKGVYSINPFESKTNKLFELCSCSQIICGKIFFAALDSGKLKLYLTSNYSLCKEFDFDNVSAVDFSSNDKFMSIIQKPVVENNLKIINLLDCSVYYETRSQVHPNTEWPQIIYSDDEKIFIIKNKTNVDIYDENKNNIGKLEHILALKTTKINIKTEEKNIILASRVIPKDNKSKSCFFVTYDINNLSKPLKEIGTSLTDRMKIKLSPDKKSALVNAINDNTSSKSYYGQSNLYYFEILTGKFIKFPLPEGPVHDFDYCSDGHFIICAGHLPAKIYYYTSDGDLDNQITQGSFNTIKISPDSRMVALCAFGSLKGDVSIYNLETFKLIGKFNFFCCVNFGWSQDSKYLLGSVLSTRVKVDNEYRILKYNGEEVIVDKEVGEIYDCFFIPEPKEKLIYEKFTIETNEKSLQEKPKSKVGGFSTLGKIDFSKNYNNTEKTDIVGLGPKKKKNKKKNNDKK